MFYVDHQALVDMNKKPQLVCKLAMWILLLKEFEFLIVHTPGMNNTIANFPSKLE